MKLPIPALFSLLFSAWLLPIARAQSFAIRSDSAAPDQLIVGMSPESFTLDEDIARVRQVSGAILMRRLFRESIWLLELTPNSPLPEIARQIEKLPSVRYVHPNAILQGFGEPDDPNYLYQWGFPKIEAPAAWDIQNDASSVVVAVIDSGTQYTHFDLKDNIWTNPGEIPNNQIDDDGNGYIDDVHGYDFVMNDGSPNDGMGHGTHTAGTIGAMTNNSLGVAGTCWKTQIMVLRFINGNNQGLLSDAVRAVEYSMDNGAQLSSNSWGCQCTGTDTLALREAIEEAGKRGLLFVAAAGNSSLDNDQAYFVPASYTLPEVVSVAASTQSDELASFSNWGLESVDLAAPGVSILSTLPGNNYGYYSGTSMATPHVAGAAALLKAYAPTRTMLEIKQVLLDTVDQRSAFQDKMVSGGRLNLRRALEQITQDQSFVYVDGSYSGSETGDNDHPFNTVVEGVNAVEPGGTIRIAPNNYPETFTALSKPMTLRAYGAFHYHPEGVVIGK